METRICIDTDIIIDHLRGRGKGVKIFEKIVRNFKPVTTCINRFELLCGARREEEIRIIEECLFGFDVLPFEGSAVEEAARIYRELKKSGKPIGMRDILIGGITIANNLSLSTNNIKDFKRIKDLKLFTV